MKTIEERAFDFAIEEAKVEGFDFGSVKDGYVQGATEQKAIDDAESGKELLYVVNKTTERVRKEAIDKACEWLRGYIGLDVRLRYLSITHLLEDFHKAMEE